VEQDGRYWPGKETDARMGHRMFFSTNGSSDPDSITITLHANKFYYTGPAASGPAAGGIGAGLLEKASARLVRIVGNEFTNTVFHMLANNSGSLEITNNTFSYSRDMGKRGIDVGYNHNTPWDQVPGYLYVYGNTFTSTTTQSAPAIAALQGAHGLLLTTTIENNNVAGFTTAIRFENANRPHHWRIVGNTTLGTWMDASSTAPDLEMHDNGVVVHSWYKFTDRLWGRSTTEGYAGGYQFYPNVFHVAGAAFNSSHVEIYRCRMSTSPYRHFLTTDPWCNGDPNPQRESHGMYGIRVGDQGSYPGTVALHRLSHPGGDIHFSANAAEIADITSNQNWVDEGAIAYVWP
jgi:hypothetical protein